MTIHILRTARRRGSVTLGPFIYCVPLEDGVGRHYDHSYIVYRYKTGLGGIMTIHILCTARRRGRVAL